MSGAPGLHARQAARQCHVRAIEQVFDLIDLHQSDPQRYPHLLQSSAHGRFDILFAFPGDSLVLDVDGHVTAPDGAAAPGSDFLTAFDDWWRQQGAVAPVRAGLPFTGGWFVYLGYELAGQIEPCLQLPKTTGALPVAIATRFRSAVIRDNQSQQSYIVAEHGQSTAVAGILADISSLTTSLAADAAAVASVHEDDPQDYLDAVGRIHAYIREGDVFQVNLSRRWEITLQQAVDLSCFGYRVNLFRHSFESNFAHGMIGPGYPFQQQRQAGRIRMRDPGKVNFQHSVLLE